MKTIWKYPLSVTDEQTVLIPKGSRLLTVQIQRGIPFLWAEVDTDVPKVNRLIETFGTGHAISRPNNPRRHIGTYQVEEQLVFHVFERLE